MKNLKGLVVAGLAMTSIQGFSKTTADLKFDCSIEGIVKVADPFYVDNSGTRALSYAGIKGELEIQNIIGPDCDKLDLYSISIKKGDLVAYSYTIGGNYLDAVEQASKEIGTLKVSKGTQSFAYETPEGELPLFPLLHKEQVQYFSVKGSLNSKDVYGSKEIENLSDLEKSNLVGKIAFHLGYGKVFQSDYFASQYEVLLDILLKLQPTDAAQLDEFFDNIFLVFKNAAATSFRTQLYSPLYKLVLAINNLVQEQGVLDSSEKVALYQKNPALLGTVVVEWSQLSGNTVPKFTNEELDTILEFALTTSVNLSKVTQVNGAVILLNQYKDFAQSLKSNFELTGDQAQFVAKILNL